jgi:hypothetical protein
MRFVPHPNPNPSGTSHHLGLSVRRNPEALSTSISQPKQLYHIHSTQHKNPPPKPTPQFSHNEHQLVDSRQPLRRRLRSLRRLWSPWPQVSRNLRRQNRQLEYGGTLSGITIPYQKENFPSNAILTLPSAHPLRRPGSRRDSFPRQAEDLGEIAADGGHDDV